MIFSLSLICVAILGLLSVLHFYWFLGGTWAFDSVLPVDDKGVIKLNPKWIDSLIVAIILSLFTFLFLIKGNAIQNLFLLNWILNYGLYFIIAIFMLRAIGDFKYVGFFKKIKKTRFAKLDTKYFSPLCFFIALCGLIIELI